MSGVKKLRGLAALVFDAVDAGSRAVERVQKGTAKRTFDVLEAIPVVAPPAHAVHLVHDACVGVTHASIRVVSRVVGVGLELALDAAERIEGQPAPAAPEDTAPAAEPPTEGRAPEPGEC